MPAYRNTGTNRVVLPDGTPIAPGQTIQNINNFITLPTGVVKDSNLPVWNPAIISSRNAGDSGTDEVSIPTSVNGKNVNEYHLDIYCVLGRVSIQFDDNSFDPPIILEAGEGYKEDIRFRRVTKVFVTYLIASSVCKIDAIFLNQ